MVHYDAIGIDILDTTTTTATTTNSTASGTTAATKKERVSSVFHIYIYIYIYVYIYMYIYNTARFVPCFPLDCIAVYIVYIHGFFFNIHDSRLEPHRFDSFDWL